jgi:hypothetical protein
MTQDDIDHILTLLDDSLSSEDWDLVQEVQQYVKEFSRNSPFQSEDEE